jgi:hypothetical protein
MALTQWTNYNKFFACAKKVGSLFFYDRNGLGNSPADLFYLLPAWKAQES